MEYTRKAIELQQLMISREITEFFEAKKLGTVKKLMHPEKYYIKLAQAWDYLGKTMIYLESAEREACLNEGVDN